VLKRQAKQGAAGIQHDIGKLYDLKNDIGEPQTIGLVGSPPEDSMQDTFLHEVFHAIMHVMDLRETESEENYVRRLATGLCTAWNNTPAAFKWRSGLVWSIRLVIGSDGGGGTDQIYRCYHRQTAPNLQKSPCRMSLLPTFA
jgi:hypothetical protein